MQDIRRLVLNAVLDDVAVSGVDQKKIEHIIDRLEDGTILLCHSGGLHHIQKPGQHLPRIFQPIRMHVEVIELTEYKARFSKNTRERKIQIVQDLQNRLDTECPQFFERSANSPQASRIRLIRK